MVLQEYGRASRALSQSRVRALICERVAVPPELLARSSVDKRHNRFVVARGVVQSHGLGAQAFPVLLV